MVRAFNVLGHVLYGSVGKSDVIGTMGQHWSHLKLITAQHQPTTTGDSQRVWNLQSSHFHSRTLTDWIARTDHSSIHSRQSHIFTASGTASDSAL